ncbi:PF07600 family protein [Leptospira alstonii serovar Pingchang str. 80-412]|uniref:PF07600 family protein n=3 Tax=Leptospira alstonii TaxID=28452 RepID=M6CPV0_9LEPT|nr:PF07600 family protein [Leptospira alstonii serovar Sichuan str. 79601]EQA80436.1 PF07600 family protein [Leptospira alstonii serovar Pingchang str. 80-412]
MILNFVSLMRSSGLDRGSVSYPSEFRQYFQGLTACCSPSVFIFCSVFRSARSLPGTVPVMGNSSFKSGFTSYSVRKSGNLCSFLIPEHLVCSTRLRPKALRKTLHLLLSHWDETLVRKRFLGKRLAYARYQEKNLNLQKMNFRPFEEDWCKLGILAWGLGISRCFLFSLLLEWGIPRKTKSRGVPTNLSITRELRFPQKLLRSQIQLGRAHPT